MKDEIYDHSATLFPIMKQKRLWCGYDKEVVGTPVVLNLA